MFCPEKELLQLPPPERAFDWPFQAVRERNWQEAAQRWAVIREAYPNLPEPWVKGAVAHIELEEFDRAEKLLSHARTSFPDDAEALIHSARLAIIEENIDLADTLSKWIPDFPNASVITIDHLLLHTSGTFSFNADLRFREENGYKTPDELLEIAKSHGNAFCPGEYWSYSNTNYVLLALILEQIEQKPFHLILTERIINPLDLKNTIALKPKQQLKGLVKGHTEDGPDEKFYESMPLGAGIIVSSAKDMVIFWHSYLTGKIIKSLSVETAFAHLYPMFGNGTFYGRGVMLYDVYNEGGEQVVWWLGHSGGTQGLKAVIAYDMMRKIYVAVALNNTASAEASANKLLAEVKLLLK